MKDFISLIVGTVLLIAYITKSVHQRKKDEKAVINRIKQLEFEITLLWLLILIQSILRYI